MASSENRDPGDSSTIDIDGWDELLPPDPATSQAALPKVPTVLPRSAKQLADRFVAEGTISSVKRGAAPTGRSTIIADAARIADAVHHADEARRAAAASDDGEMARAAVHDDGDDDDESSQSSATLKELVEDSALSGPRAATATGRFRVANAFAPSPPALNLSDPPPSALFGSASRRTGLDFVRAVAGDGPPPGAALSDGRDDSSVSLHVDDDDEDAFEEVDTDSLETDDAEVAREDEFDVVLTEAAEEAEDAVYRAADASEVAGRDAVALDGEGIASMGKMVAPPRSGLSGGAKLGILAAAAAVVLGIVVVSMSGGSDSENDVVAAAVVSDTAKPSHPVADPAPLPPKPEPAAPADAATAAKKDVEQAHAAIADGDAGSTAVPATAEPQAAVPPATEGSPAEGANAEGANAAVAGETAPADEAKPGSEAAAADSDTPPPDNSEDAAEDDGDEDEDATGYGDDGRVYSQAELMQVPAGTDDAAARSFQARTPVPGDRPPLGAVGPGGVHIDRIMIGSKHRRRGCDPKTDPFQIDVDPEVVVCFRVVLAHKGERLTLRWQRDGETMRRAFLPLRGTRVRNGRVRMPVRDKFAGDWTVEISTRSGEVLATAPFTIRSP